MKKQNLIHWQVQVWKPMARSRRAEEKVRRAVEKAVEDEKVKWAQKVKQAMQKLEAEKDTEMRKAVAEKEEEMRRAVEAAAEVAEEATAEREREKAELRQLVKDVEAERKEWWEVQWKEGGGGRTMEEVRMAGRRMAERGSSGEVDYQRAEAWCQGWMEGKAERRERAVAVKEE